MTLRRIVFSLLCLPCLGLGGMFAWDARSSFRRGAERFAEAEREVAELNRYPRDDRGRLRVSGYERDSVLRSRDRAKDALESATFYRRMAREMAWTSAGLLLLSTVFVTLGWRRRPVPPQAVRAPAAA